MVVCIWHERPVAASNKVTQERTTAATGIAVAGTVIGEKSVNELVS